MSATCQSCKGRAQLFLCRNCINSLREMLEEYPWWINRLIEAAVGQVRLGDGGKRQVRTMHGDDELASHIESLPGCSCEDECDCDRVIARAKRQRSALAHALALGRVNASASELHDDARNTLGTWIRHLSESRGIRLVDRWFMGPLRPNEERGPGYTAVGFAKWLHAHVSAIANDEAAGECVDELSDLRKRIERAVNRPQPRKFLGKCPTWDDETRTVCGRELSAPAEAIEIRCKNCQTTHNCNRLQLLLVSDQEREKVTMARVRQLNRNLPPEYRIPERTMRRWIAEGRLKPRGYLRPDGSRGVAKHSDDDEPLYLWADVRRTRGDDRKMAKSG